MFALRYAKWVPHLVTVAVLAGALAAGKIAAILDGSLDRFSRGVTLAVAVPPSIVVLALILSTTFGIHQLLCVRGVK